MHGLNCVAAILAWLFLLPTASPPTLTIAAAADLNFALTDLAARFEHESGARVRLSFGSSGNLFAQIQNGAPFDVFLSADMAYARQLDLAGLGVPGTLTRYATGRLALVVPAHSRLALEREGMHILLSPEVRRVAIANPQHAPYGRAAEGALRHFGIYERVAPKLVLGENVSQAAQFVQSGNAQAGLVALSLARGSGIRARYWIVPEEAYPALEQGAVVVKSSRNAALARRFLEFLKSPAAREVLTRYGFAVPEKP